MTKAAAIYEFWTRFGIPAYEENAVPSDAVYPYLTYEFVYDRYDRPVLASASIWDRTDSWVSLNAKADEIGAYIGLGGVVIPCGSGYIWIKQGSPFAQNMGDVSDEKIKRKYISVVYEYLSL